MKRILLVLVILAVLLWIGGEQVARSGHSPDESLAATIPWMLAIIIALLAAALAVGWGAWAIFF